jgi:hypothetical protein
MFKKAQRSQAKLRLAIAGPSGSGKTYSSLLMASGIGGKIAVIDTEHGSASLYADLVDFDVMELHAPYSPERYIEAIEAAEKAGYDVLVIDSYSHEWTGAGGCLEINDSTAKARYKGNTWSAWSETTPRHRKLVDKILTSPLHIICTMRSKTETAQGENKKVVKLGMKSEQRDGAEYEFTVVLDLVHDGNMAVASKDRTRLFQHPELISRDTGKRLQAWLNCGESQSERKASRLDEFVSQAAGIDDPESLKSAFGAAWRELAGNDDLRGKAKAAYDEHMKRIMEIQQ